MRTLQMMFVAGVLVTTQAARAYDFLGSDLGPGVPAANADVCNADCNANASCVAWTFVKAGAVPRLGGAALCFLKSSVPPPTLDADCSSNALCVSGIKRSDGWCGETPLENVGSSGVQGQGQVLSCPSGLTCTNRVTARKPKPWYCFFLPFLDVCHPTQLQSTDLFCQS